jgi:hypothetical protein
MLTHPTASSIGCYAQQSLVDKTEGKVIGVTSHGVFLLFGTRSIFVTTNQHLSPFNIILPATTSFPDDITVGDIAYFSMNELLVPARQWIIPLIDVPIWTPSRPMPVQNSEKEQAEAARQILAELRRLDQQKGYLFLGNHSAADSNEQSGIRRAATAFSQAFQNNNQEACIEASTALFGKGTGLTPSGDDWLTGFILYPICRTLAQNKTPRGFINSLGAELVFTARRFTTTVSANRLEAALSGWTEEFFIQTVNYLFAATTFDAATLAGQLANFGHSSGVDTFMGIYFACTSQK